MRKSVFLPALGLSSALLIGTYPSGSQAQTPTSGPPPRPVFHPEKLGEMDAAVNAAIEDKQCPGGVLWFEREEAVYHKAYGNRALIPIVESMTEDTIFDAASLTKVMATAPAILLLIEQGRVGLDEPVNAFIPEFARDGRDAITVRHLLTHTSGLRPGIPAYPPWTGYEKAVQLACAEKPTA